RFVNVSLIATDERRRYQKSFPSRKVSLEFRYVANAQIESGWFCRDGLCVDAADTRKFPSYIQSVCLPYLNRHPGHRARAIHRAAHQILRKLSIRVHCEGATLLTGI